MTLEKVLFVYTSLVREGMPVGSLVAPEPVLFNMDKNRLHIIAVMASIVTHGGSSYWHEVDITHNGKSMISPDHDGMSSYNVLNKASFNEELAHLACFNIHGVMLPNPGLYTASVSIYDNDELGNKRNLLDSKESHFIVVGES